jgi:hypothetical protein
VLLKGPAVALAMLLGATAAVAQPPEPAATPTPTPAQGKTELAPPLPTPTALPIADAEPTAEPTPELSAEPASELFTEPTPDLLLDELVGPPSPDDPVARIKAELTVKDEKKRKKIEQRKAKLAGKVKTDEDKEWLSEICPLDVKYGGTWLDRSQERLGWSVCRATLWFDGLFGDERAITERDATYGYVQPKLDYNEEDGIDPDARFRGNFNFPVADRRFNALLGRNDDDDDQHGSDSSQSDGPGDDQLPDSFREADDDWLVGLGYSPVRGARRRIDFDAGVELRSPIDVFAQGRYRRHWFLSERDLIRLRQTVFWRTDDGLGTRLNLDFERVLSGPFVARWRSGATYAQELEGVEWFEELTLFQRLDLKTALAYVLNADGATDAEVPVKNYGFELIYRRNILREWLFLELRPGIDWRRREVEDDRELEPVMSVGLQINFGDKDFE